MTSEWTLKSGTPLGRLTAVLMLGIIVLAYVMALRVGRWPPSHPVSGISLLALAVFQWFMPVGPVGPLNVLRFGASALSLTGALFWLLAVVAMRGAM